MEWVLQDTGNPTEVIHYTPHSNRWTDRDHQPAYSKLDIALYQLLLR